MSNNFRKPNVLLDQEKHVIEYTSGQLIFAICIALIVALLCFLLGMFVRPGSQQPQMASTTPARDTAKAAATPSRSPGEPSAAKSTSPRKEGQQTLPKPSVLSNAKATTPKPVSAPTEGTPRSVELPPLDSSSAPKPAADAGPRKPPETPRPAALPKPGDAPKSVELPPTTEHAASPAPSGEKSKATENPKKEVASLPPDKAQSTQGPATENTSTPGLPDKKVNPTQAGALDKASSIGFTIQLAAFAPTEADKAEKYKSRLGENTDLKPEIMKSKDGKYIRVVTGAYPNRAAAEKAREELAKRAEFSKCFVRVRE